MKIVVVENIIQTAKADLCEMNTTTKSDCGCSTGTLNLPALQLLKICQPVTLHLKT